MAKLMWLLDGCWDFLTPASHCVTTSQLAAATEMTVRIIPVFPRVLHRMPSCHNPRISGLGTGTEYAGSAKVVTDIGLKFCIICLLLLVLMMLLCEKDSQTELA